MAVSIQATDLDDWQPFLSHQDVQASVSLTTTQGSTQPTGISCINNRFWNLPFGSAFNASSRRFGDNVGNTGNGAVMALTDQDTKLDPIKMGDLLANVGILDYRDRESFVSDLIDLLSGDLTFNLDPGEHRNAMWITPGEMLSVDTALSLIPTASPDLDRIKTTVMGGLGISGLTTIGMPTIVFQRTCRGLKSETEDDNGLPGPPEWHVTSTYRLSFKIKASSFIFWITLEPMGLDLCVTRDWDQDAILGADSFWSNLDRLSMGRTDGVSTGLATNDIKPVADFLSDRVEFLGLKIERDAQQQFSFKVLAVVNLKKGDKAEDGVDVYLMYDSLAKAFTGGLVLKGFYDTDADRALASFDPTVEVRQRGSVTFSDAWDLTQYFSDPGAIPQGVPTAISAATVTMTLGDSKTVAFAATIVVPPRKATGSLPCPFVWEYLDVYFQKSHASFACAISTHFTLMPPDGSKGIDPATMSLSFEYDTGSWRLLGYVEALSCSLLFSFFDVHDQSAVVDVLGKLKIEELALLWTHTAQGAAASFLFTGIVTFGELKLRLFYQYASSEAGDNTTIKDALKQKGGPKVQTITGNNANNQPATTWVFECDLETSSGKATIGSVANSILENAADTLPAFVADIKIPAADGAAARAPVSLNATKDSGGRIIFTFELAIGPFSLTFVQVADSTNIVPTKRLVRFAVDKFPTKQNIPLLNELPQPFDQLEYVWVSEAGGGFLKSDVDAIAASGFLTGTNGLMYKSSGKTDAVSKDAPDRPEGQQSAKPKPDPNPVVLAKGHHFMVIQNGQVSVDHIFFASSAKQSPNPVPNDPSTRSLANTAVVKTASVTDDKPPDPSPPSKGALKFKLGPLSIDSVGLQFKEKAGKKFLQVTMDATFTMGPISLTLIGFGLAVTLDGFTLDNLKEAIKDVDVVLSGLALSFNKPPLLVAGGFEHAIVQTKDGSGKSVTEDIFMGGIGVSFPPYTFVGLGEYAVVDLGGTKYKSVFLFAKLDGPLITLEFATISGVRLGLGYNSVVRSPKIEELTDFPFINDGSIDGHGNDPMAILKSMTETTDTRPVAWVTPQLDSYWFAAGMSITAFDILKITAVAMLSFRDTGLVASIYADAIAQMPPDAPKEAVIVYVEIGMIVEMNFIDGYFRVEAALAPTSFLLVPQCHLYGGFALVYWFPPSDHTGDWVFTVGGYHRSYSPPAWYPVPRRLGISFQLDILSITGESYFAITPKCAMGGAMLHVSLSFGPISAWLDARFDALVNFHPLHYSVDFSIDIGVVFDADILFIHIHISAHVGASLHIEGPEFGGVAHVDFYLFGFDVDFGASPSPPAALDIYQFWNALHKPGPANAPDDASGHDAPLQSLLSYDVGLRKPLEPASPQTIAGAAHKYILEDGNFPMPKTPEAGSQTAATSTGAGSEWYVKGGSLKFRIASDFALSKATVNLSHETMDKAIAEAKAKGIDPQNLPTTRSTGLTQSDIYCKPMHITTSQYKALKSTSVLNIDVKNANTNEIIDSWRSIELAYKDVPTALWTPYDPQQDPTHQPGELLKGDNATIKQAMSVILTAPPPILSPPFDLPGFIPKFKATAAARFGILDFRTADQKGSTQQNPLPADATGGTHWYVPWSESKQVLSMRTEDNQLDNAARWANMRKFWNGLESSTKDIVDDSTTTDPGTKVTTVQPGLLTMVAQTLGWDVNRPEVVVPTSSSGTTAPAQTPTPAPVPVPTPIPSSATAPTATPIPVLRPMWKLTGSIPTKLTANLEAMYLDLPRIATVSTTA